MWLRGLSREDFRRFIPGSLAGFLLLTSYECLRSPSNVLFQSVFGTENLPVVMTALPVVLVLLIAAYNILLSHFGPRKTLRYLTAASAILLTWFGYYAHLRAPWAVAGLFLWGQSYIVVLGEQYWSYFDSAFSPETGKKTHGVIAGIMSIGSFSGGMLVHFLSSRVGTTGLPFIGAGLLLPAMLLFDRAYRRAPELANHVSEEKSESIVSGVRLFRTSPVLLFLALAVLATQVLSTTLGLTFQTLLHQAMPSLDAQTAYSGRFYAIVGVLSLVFQFFITPVALQWARPEWIQVALPFIHLTSVGYLLLHPTVLSASIAFALFKSLDYSLFRASKEILYMPLSYEARYRAKEWIDVFGYRIGKGFASGLVWGGQRLFLMGNSYYTFLSVGAVLAWLLINRRILGGGSVYNDLTESATVPR